MFIKNKPIEGSIKFNNIVKNSSKVMLMDAYITTRSYNMVKDIMGDAMIKEKKCYYLKNKFKYPKREYIDADKGAFIKQINKKLNDGKRCVVVCGSKKLSDIIDSMRESDLKDLAGDERNFVLQIVKKHRTIDPKKVDGI